MSEKITNLPKTEAFKMDISVKEQGKDLLGFRQEWISGTYGDTKFEVLTGAGLGNKWLMLYATKKDGTQIRHCIDIGEVTKSWLENVIGKE